MTAGGLMGGLGPRERRWLLGFLILGSAYFAVLLLQMAFAFMAGFSQIILIVFLASEGTPGPNRYGPSPSGPLGQGAATGW